ncbi:MAG: NUDIX hydrolase [Candidatus Limnocylindrales bacterium]|jgi:ADP-ribose pyrophosphatase YjhB (NUDIX family)
MSEVRFGQGGVPDWLEPMVRFCSRCGGELKFGPITGEERDRLACPGCGFVFYVNPRLVVTTLPINDRGEVMLIRRGIAPGYNKWAQPGGFLEIDETVREAAIRETLEETGLQVDPGRIVGLYSRVQAAVVVVAYEARIVGGEPRVTNESLETRPFAPDRIPWPEIAFETSVRAIRDWVASVRPDLPLPDTSTIKREFGA